MYLTIPKNIQTPYTVQASDGAAVEYDDYSLWRVVCWRCYARGLLHYRNTNRQLRRNVQRPAFCNDTASCFPTVRLMRRINNNVIHVILSAAYFAEQKFAESKDLHNSPVREISIRSFDFAYFAPRTFAPLRMTLGIRLFFYP